MRPRHRVQQPCFVVAVQPERVGGHASGGTPALPVHHVPAQARDQGPRSQAGAGRRPADRQQPAIALGTGLEARGPAAAVRDGPRAKIGR